MAQSPMISIPKKTTEEVDWTTPVRNLIAQSYGENPDNYATECAALQRCRQDAVRGAGSDMTARDLLYKYFGQLELLELRFSEIRVNFPWHDAFTNKLITQTSIAYEKASILFQIASTHSAIASAQSRSDPEGLKRAFYYFRSCAGMLNYINENFLHAPSTDLSREVVKFLVTLILAQATEVFFEKCTDEKKGNTLVAKIASQAASMYTTLTEDVKEFQGKGIFDRNWVTIVQIKSKLFTSLAQYYRGTADNAAGKHGEALTRFIQAENLAKEASRSATSFGSSFVSGVTSTLPSDAGSSLQERTKAHLALCTERRNDAQRENDLIYNAILPSVEALPPIEKTVVANPIHIHEVYSAPDVQKTIGQDFFIRLVPLSVHESASVYSEEKAKLVRGEVEKAEAAEGESRSALDGLGIKEGLVRFKAMAEGEVGEQEEIPLEVRRWKEDIALVEDRDGVDGLMRELNKLKVAVHHELEGISRDLEIESKDCEMMRVKYEHLWTQQPSAGLSKTLRQDLKSHFGALEAASTSDQQVSTLWESVQADIQLLLSHDVERLFKERAGPSVGSLLDLDVGSETEDAQERAKIKGYVNEIEERLSTLSKISRERGEVLKDLKDKIQADDVSHLLLLNRRNTGVEPTLFAAELEKFRPYQQRLAATVHHQEIALQEITTIWKNLRDLAGRGAGARKWDEREKKKKETIRRFSRARDGYMEVRDGLAKGLQFYTELTELTSKLRVNVRTFVSNRVSERETLAGKLEMEGRLSTIPHLPLPSLPPPPPKPNFENSFASMSLREAPVSHSPTQWQAVPPPPPQQYGNGMNNGVNSQRSTLPHQHPQSPPPSGYSSPYGQQYNPPPSQSHSTPPRQSSQSSFLPPPPQRTQSSFIPPTPANDPYASLSIFNPSGFSSQGQGQNNQQQQQQNIQSPHRQHTMPQQDGFGYSFSAPQPSQHSYQQYQQPQQQHQQYQSQQYGGLPSSPPPMSYQYTSPSGPPPPPPPPQQQQQQPPYQGYNSQTYGGYSQHGYGQ